MKRMVPTITTGCVLSVMVGLRLAPVRDKRDQVARTQAIATKETNPDVKGYLLLSRTKTEIRKTRRCFGKPTID